MPYILMSGELPARPPQSKTFILVSFFAVGHGGRVTVLFTQDRVKNNNYRIVLYILIQFPPYEAKNTNVKFTKLPHFNLRPYVVHGVQRVKGAK